MAQSYGLKNFRCAPKRLSTATVGSKASPLDGPVFELDQCPFGSMFDENVRTLDKCFAAVNELRIPIKRPAQENLPMVAAS
jgi:hypothetical protein